jgi:uncharacterized SAM-binding protein YcdF (DUF218 family)
MGSSDDRSGGDDTRSREQRLRDRNLLAAVENRRSVGEEMDRTGEIPMIERPDPAIPASIVPTPRPVDRTPMAGLRVSRRRIWPRVVQLGAALITVASVYFVYTAWQVYSTGTTDQRRQVDAIVVMGAAQYDGRPSPQLEARLDHVIELWPQGLAPLVVVTGGKRPGDRFTEAQASADYLVDHGVDPSAILQETVGTTSYESLDVVQALLEIRGLDSVLIVTDPYHCLRSRMIAAELGLTAYVSPTDTSVVTGARSVERHLGEAAGISVGRIIGFDRLSALTG